MPYRMLFSTFSSYIYVNKKLIYNLNSHKTISIIYIRNTMGIKDYHKWMVATHPDAFKKKWLNEYEHLYIDINYTLHHVQYGTTNQNQIIYKFFVFIENLVNLTKPTKSIVIANDGPAPIAKLLLQRDRRLSASREIKNLDTSSLIFTPGTEFMNTIQSKLEKYMDKIKITYDISVDYMIGCEGEAELKLKYKIMENVKKNPNHNHIIMSNDADIIAMFGTFGIQEYSKIFICGDSRLPEILSMGCLMDLHTKKFGMTKTFGLDFTFLSIILGNDYLPKIDFVDLTKVWESYSNYVKQHPEGLFHDCIENDSQTLKQNFCFNIPFFKKIINGIMRRTKQHFIKQFKIDDMNTLLYSNYMEGLLWCLDMYNKGKCDKYNYMYQMDDTPHPFGLLLNLDLNKDICKFKGGEYPSLNQNLYAILVFPQKAIDLIDKKYHNFAKKNDILYEQELCETCNEMYNELYKYTSSEQKYKDKAKEIKLHKKIHNRITVNDIEDITNDFTIEFF
jgi:hypothetical protein